MFPFLGIIQFHNVVVVGHWKRLAIMGALPIIKVSIGFINHITPSIINDQMIIGKLLNIFDIKNIVRAIPSLSNLYNIAYTIPNIGLSTPSLFAVYSQ